MSVAVNNPSEEIQLMRKLHGNLVLEESGFLKKVTQKDSDLNKRAAETYYSNWQDKKNIENNEEHVENRREHAQVMTNAFYDLVTDFYEYGKCMLSLLYLCMKGGPQLTNLPFPFPFFLVIVQAGANLSTLPNYTRVRDYQISDGLGLAVFRTTEKWTRCV
jgi:hypothetical protein